MHRHRPGDGTRAGARDGDADAGAGQVVDAHGDDDQAGLNAGVRRTIALFGERRVAERLVVDRGNAGVVERLNDVVGGRIEAVVDERDPGPALARGKREMVVVDLDDEVMLAGLQAADGKRFAGVDHLLAVGEAVIGDVEAVVGVVDRGGREFLGDAGILRIGPADWCSKVSSVGRDPDLADLGERGHGGIGVDIGLGVLGQHADACRDAHGAGSGAGHIAGYLIDGGVVLGRHQHIAVGADIGAAADISERREIEHRNAGRHRHRGLAGKCAGSRH